MESRDRQSSRHSQPPQHKRNPSLDAQSDLWDIKSTSSWATGINCAVPLNAASRMTHTNSLTWKSTSTKLQGEFDRMQRLVRLIAPEQFKHPAKPTNGPCDIVPKTLGEYIEHTKEMLQMKAKEMQRNIALKEAGRVQETRTIGSGRAKVPPAIMLRFGARAVVYPDERSPVLCQETMWYTDPDKLGVPKVKWPTQAELQACGDKRENSAIFTRCGRFLPAPRIRMTIRPSEQTTYAHRANAECSYIKKLLPFDEHGPIYDHGPSPMEILRANVDTDNDPRFEELGRAYLGEALMEDVGEWSPACVPQWLIERQQVEARVQAMYAAGEPAPWGRPEW